MADLGDLTTLLSDESKTLSDLDWVNVDEEEYREYEKLPKQNLDAIPDLEEQWGYLTDEDKYRLSPENREPSKPNTPFWSEREISNDLTDDVKLEVVEQFLRKHLMAGTTAKEATTLLKSHFDKSVLAKATDTIKKAFSERGLIGTVYVDSSLFPNCDQGEGQDFVGRHNKGAKFVVAKDKCSGCVWAKEEKCSRFQKELVFDIQYTEDTWAFYRNKAESLGKDLSGIPEHFPVKEKIRNASLAPLKQGTEAIDGRPVVRNLAATVSSKQALTSLESAEIQREVVANVYRSGKLKKIGKAMLEGNHGPEVRDAIASDKGLASLEPHVNLMGRLYADLSFFDTREAADAYLKEHKGLLTYGKPSDEKVASSSFQSFSLNSPKALNRILHRYALSQYGPDYEATKGEVIAKMGKRVASFNEDKLRSFAQSVYASPLPEKIRHYEHLAPSIFDPTRGISSSEARQSVAETEITREKVDSRYRPEIARKLAHKMLKGDHSDAMASRLASEGFDTLEAHIHLMGRLYVLSSYVTKDELAKFKNPKLSSLPYLASSELEEFFEKDSTKAAVLKRYAKVKGFGTSTKGRKVIASLYPKIQEMPTSEFQSFTQMIYSRPVFSKTAEYHSYDQNPDDPTLNLTPDQAESKLRSKKVTRTKVVKNNPRTANIREGETFADLNARNKVARRMLAGDHGPAIKALIDTDPVLFPLKPHMNLLGRLYTASFPFTKEEEKAAFTQRNAHLQSLPVMEDMKAFFSKEITHSAILRRMALAKGLHPVDDEDKIAALVELKLPEMHNHSVSTVHKIAQATFGKILPLSVKKYRHAIYSTTQVKESEMEVSPKDLESFKTKINSKEAGTATRDLRYYLKKNGGRKIIATLNARFGMDLVKTVWLSQNKTSSNVRNYAQGQKLEEVVLAAVTDPEFQPVGTESVLLPEFFETKIGRWLRDRMLSGSYGSKLSSEIRKTFSEEDIVKNAPLILAMREEEGLFGRSYSTADSFADCAVGKRAMNETLSQIVKGSKCGGCVYNKSGSCLLYGKDLLPEPKYNERQVQKALGYRVRSGSINRRDAKSLVSQNMNLRDKVRMAHTQSSSTDTLEADISTTGFYGNSLESAKSEKKVGSMLYEARQLLMKGNSSEDVKENLKSKFGSQVFKMGSVYLDKIIERTQNHMSDLMDERTLNATTGLEQMEELEMTASHVNSEMGNIEFNKESTQAPMEGISFGGFTTE